MTSLASIIILLSLNCQYNMTNFNFSGHLIYMITNVMYIVKNDLGSLNYSLYVTNVNVFNNVFFIPLVKVFELINLNGAFFENVQMYGNNKMSRVLTSVMGAVISLRASKSSS